MNETLPDSGQRTAFDTGAVRDSMTGKGLPSMIPPIAIRAMAKRFEDGASKYGRNNWMRGIPLSRYHDSIARHLLQWAEGDASEDHGGAVLWNMAAAMWTENEIYKGNLSENLDDRPYAHSHGGGSAEPPTSVQPESEGKDSPIPYTLVESPPVSVEKTEVDAKWNDTKWIQDGIDGLKSVKGAEKTEDEWEYFSGFEAKRRGLQMGNGEQDYDYSDKRWVNDYTRVYWIDQITYRRPIKKGPKTYTKNGWLHFNGEMAKKLEYDISRKCGVRRPASDGVMIFDAKDPSEEWANEKWYREPSINDPFNGDEDEDDQYEQ